MSPLAYKNARAWAKSIASRVTNGTMPPWHPDPAFGHFPNARRVSDADRRDDYEWVTVGPQRGQPADLQARPTYETTFPI